LTPLIEARLLVSKEIMNFDPLGYHTLTHDDRQVQLYRKSRIINKQDRGKRELDKIIKKRSKNTR
jgi:hypothetical protein